VIDQEGDVYLPLPRQHLIEFREAVSVPLRHFEVHGVVIGERIVGEA
jgi:hypothetical protein